MADLPRTPITRQEEYLSRLAGENTTLPREPITREEMYLEGAIARVEAVEEEVEELKNNPDVVDIVNTYADLQAYDTSTLTDKDIIRVLEDSTHSNGSTYYRWNATASQFDYIGEAGGGGPTVVQTTGTSTTDVMSQKVSSEILYGEGAPSKKIALVNISANERISPSSGQYNSIGNYSVLLSADWTNAAGNDNVLIGAGGGLLGPSSPNTSLQGCVAIGYNATNDYNGSVSLGSFTRTSSVGEVNIGSSNANFGYNSTNYRLITGVHDPVNAHDAATKGYVDASAGGIKMLTDDDFNFPTNEPSVLAPWLLPPGQYIIAPHTDVMPDGNSSTYDSSVPFGIIVFTQAMSSGGGYGTFIISGNELNGYYKVQYNGTPVAGFPHEL